MKELIEQVIQMGNYDLTQILDTIDCKESFRNRQTLVGRIIKCTFKPLCCRSNGRI